MKHEKVVPPPIDRETVQAAIEARLADAIADRTDVRFEITGRESDDNLSHWWIDIYSGEPEAEIIVSPNGLHMVTVDDLGYFERPLDGDLLADFIRAL